MIVLFESLIVPLNICFDVVLDDALTWAPTIFFSIDIILNFMTGFFHDGILVMRQTPIIKNYLRSWFVIDVLATVPWTLLIGNDARATFIRYFKVGKLMRMARLLRLAKLK